MKAMGVGGGWISGIVGYRHGGSDSILVYRVITGYFCRSQLMFLVRSLYELLKPTL